MVTTLYPFYHHGPICETFPHTIIMDPYGKTFPHTIIMDPSVKHSFFNFLQVKPNPFNVCGLWLVCLSAGGLGDGRGGAARPALPAVAGHGHTGGVPGGCGPGVGTWLAEQLTRVAALRYTTHPHHTHNSSHVFYKAVYLFIFICRFTDLPTRKFWKKRLNTNSSNLYSPKKYWMTHDLAINFHPRHTKMFWLESSIW